MYRYAYHLIRRYWGMILFFSAMLGLLATSERWLGEASLKATFCEIFVYGTAIYYFHWTLLTGKTKRKSGKRVDTPRPKWRFWVALVCVGLLPAAIATVSTLKIATTLAPQILENKTAFSGISFLVWLPATSLTISLIGTIIPAAVLGQSLRFGKALSRGRKSFFFVLGRLIAGPGIAGAAFSALHFSVVRAGAVPDLSTSNPMALVTYAGISTIENAFALALTALTAAVLSMAYMRAEGLGALPFLQEGHDEPIKRAP